MDRIAARSASPYASGMRQPASRRDRIVHAALLAACIAPLLRLVAGVLTRSLGPDPVETIAHVTGIWSLRLLLATLALTPLVHFTGWRWLSAYRRSLGLCAYFYACLHLSSYVVFDQYFDWRDIGEDLLRRLPLTAGLACFVLMTPLAATSSELMAKYLGIKRWRKLHRLAYLAAAMAVFHYFWLVKQDVTVPSMYAVALAILTILRLQPRRVGEETSAQSGSKGSAIPPDGPSGRA